MTTQSLEQLLARVRKATGPDREIDWAVMVISDGKNPDEYKIDRTYLPLVPKATASVDACITLAARVLPGPSIWRLARNSLGFEAAVFVGGHSWIEDADTAPLAFLAAILAALISQRERTEG